MKPEISNKLLNLVKDNYQKIAQEFDATRKKEIWPELKNLAQSIPNGARILDVGCGNGRLLDLFQNKKINYLGVDNSEELIKIARLNYPTHKFITGDLLNLETISGHFDYIFCVAVLPHIPGQKLRLKAFEELREKLASSGKIILSVWNLWNRAANKKKYRSLIFKNSLLKIIGRNKLDFGDLVFPWKNSRGEEISQRYYHVFTKLELKDLAKKTGLNIERITCDPFNYWLILK